MHDHKGITVSDNPLHLVCTLDKNGKFREISPAVERILGYAPYEMMGRHLFEFLCEEDVEDTLSAYLALTEKKQNLHCQNRFYKKDGTMAYLSWQLCFSEKDGSQSWFGYDLTQQRRIRQALIKNHQRILYVMQAAHDAIWDWDLVTDKVFWGYGYKEFFGYENNDSSGNKAAWHTRIHPDDYERVMSSVNRAWENGDIKWQEEYRYKRIDGSYAFVTDRAIILRDGKNRAYEMIGAMHDDTERKKAEDELKLSEQRFKELVQSSSDLISIMNSEGVFIFVSPTAEQMLGYNCEFLRKKTALEFIHPDDLPQVKSGLEKVATDHIVHLKPYRFRHNNGEWRWIETVLTNLTDNPAVKGIVANSRDITEKKSIKKQLEQLSMIAKETNNPVVITDPAGKITWVNQAFTLLYEYSSEEIMGKSPLKLLAGTETGKEATERLKEVATKLECVESDIIYYSKSGKKYHIAAQVQPVFDETGKLIQFFGLHHDITLKKQLEQQLLIEQKERQRKIAMEVITAQEKERSEIGRELHDNVNQILAVIKLYLEKIARDYNKIDGLLPQCISYTKLSIEEIRKVSKNLCASDSQDFNLEGSINELVKSLRIGSNISYKIKTAGLKKANLSERHKLYIYRIIQEQLNNIIKYANAKEVYVCLQTSPAELRVTIKDDGDGFDAKKKREKTGIGLKNIITRASVHFGKVKINSSPGKGCTLTVVYDLMKRENEDNRLMEKSSQ